MNDLPDSCLRGIPKKDFLTPEGLSYHAFKPDERTADSRQDKGQETSVNWEDDESVVESTLRRRDEKGHITFPYGLARLPCHKIDQLNSEPGSRSALTCERNPLPDNPYHGNIVFRFGLSKATVNMIAGALALAASVIRAPR